MRAGGRQSGCPTYTRIEAWYNVGGGGGGGGDIGINSTKQKTNGFNFINPYLNFFYCTFL